MRKLPTTRAVTADPITATPSVEPICRLVEANAAATPACSRGRPETAVFVMGAFTTPKPNPKIAYAVNSHASEVSASSRVSISVAMVMAMPAAMSDGRGPRLPTSRPEIGAKISVIPAIGQRVEAGVQRGQAPNVLQIKGVQEQEAAEGGEREDRDGRRAAERGAAKEPDLDERLEAAALVADAAR